jgi:hypothetical protein
VQCATDHEHRSGMSVIRPARPVLSHRTTELGAGKNHGVLHAITEIRHQCRHRL